MYYCEACPALFPTDECLLEHLFSTRHVQLAEQGWLCHVCQSTFPSVVDFHSHHNDAAHMRRYCPQCHLSFRTKAHKKHHFRHVSHLTKCHICEQDFPNLSTFLVHVRGLHGIEPPSSLIDSPSTIGIAPAIAPHEAIVGSDDEDGVLGNVISLPEAVETQTPPETPAPIYRAVTPDHIVYPWLAREEEASERRKENGRSSPPAPEVIFCTAYSCPLCFEERDDLSCCKCGHLFCTS